MGIHSVFYDYSDDSCYKKKLELKRSEICDIEYLGLKCACFLNN